jgi:hypothetical protein
VQLSPKVVDSALLLSEKNNISPSCVILEPHFGSLGTQAFVQAGFALHVTEISLQRMT